MFTGVIVVRVLFDQRRLHRKNLCSLQSVFTTFVFCAGFGWKLGLVFA